MHGEFAVRSLQEQKVKATREFAVLRSISHLFHMCTNMWYSSMNTKLVKSDLIFIATIF